MKIQLLYMFVVFCLTPGVNWAIGQTLTDRRQVMAQVLAR